MPSLDSGLYLHIMHFHACENHSYGGGLSLQKNMNFEREHTNRGRESPVHAATLWPNIQPGLEEVFVRGLSPLHPGRISCSSCLEPWPSESFISRSWLACGWVRRRSFFGSFTYWGQVMVPAATPHLFYHSILASGIE